MLHYKDPHLTCSPAGVALWKAVENGVISIQWNLGLFNNSWQILYLQQWCLPWKITWMDNTMLKYEINQGYLLVLTTMVPSLPWSLWNFNISLNGKSHTTSLFNTKNGSSSTVRWSRAKASGPAGKTNKQANKNNIQDSENACTGSCLLPAW